MVRSWSISIFYPLNLLAIHRAYIYPLIIRGVCNRNRLRQNGSSGITSDLSGIAACTILDLGRIDE